MNIDTMLAEIRAKTQRGSAEDRWTQLRAVSAAIRLYSREKFRFNSWTTEITLEGERTKRSRELMLDDLGEVYEDPYQGGAVPAGYSLVTRGYDASILRVRGLFYLDNRPRPEIPPRSFAQLQEQVPQGRETGFMRWAPDADDVIVRPAPALGTVVGARVVRDIGTPWASWDGTDWTVIVDDQKVDFEYTNGWFTDAYDLVIQRALYALWMNEYGNQARALRAMTLAHEQLAVLRRDDSLALTSGGSVEPWGN